MKRKYFGPTPLSFLLNLKYNLIFVIIPLIFWCFNIEWKEMTLIFLLGFIPLLGIHLIGVSRVYIQDDAMVICKFKSHKILWKDIKKITTSEMYAFSGTGKAGGYYTEFGLVFHLKSGNKVCINDTMWHDKIVDEFFGLLQEKGFQYQFKIEKQKLI